MRSKALLTMSSMGMVAFGFLCYMQGFYILTELNDIVCYEDGTGFTSLWIPDLAFLIIPAILSTLCFNIVLMEVTK